jgi:valyl-tRNA synthetase
MWEGRQSDEVNENTGFAVEWFGERLNEARLQLDVLYKEFRLSEALKTIYSLIWDDFCSWYLEWVKPGFEQPISTSTYQKTVGYFEELLLLLHPFMPFITEEIYHQLKQRAEGDDITIKQAGKALEADSSLLNQGQLLKDLITGLRDVRNKQQLKPKESIKLFVETSTPASYPPIQSILCKQVNAESIEFVSASVEGSINAVIGKEKFYLQSEQPIDTANQKEEMEKELSYLKGFLESVEKKLGNERFVMNAKPEVVDVERKKKADSETKIQVLMDSLSKLA